jgi:hypothetical protein
LQNNTAHHNSSSNGAIPRLEDKSPTVVSVVGISTQVVSGANRLANVAVLALSMSQN